MATSANSRFLLDTTVLVHYTRGKELAAWIENRYQLQKLSASTPPLICEVTVGELYSLALQNKWNEKQWKELKRLIGMCVVVPVSLNGVHQAYAEIDCFSQKSAPIFTPRNMGKNDVWIAATAHVTKATLLTCDHDFDHLNPQWLRVEYIDPQSAKKQKDSQK